MEKTAESIIENMHPLFRHNVVVSLHSNDRSGKTGKSRAIREAKTLSEETAGVRVFVYEWNSRKEPFYRVVYFLKNQDYYTGRSIGSAYLGEWRENE